MPPAPQSDVHEAITAALAATAGESDSVKSAAVTAAAANIPQPNAKTTNTLWLMLVSVLGLVVLVSAISGVVYALQNKAAPPDVVITIFTTSFSGLIGLFVKPPAT
jgi:uncharacterized membrane-anchored protein